MAVPEGESDGVGDVSTSILGFLGGGDEDLFQVVQIVVSREERAVRFAEIERIEIFRIGSCKLLGYLLCASLSLRPCHPVSAFTRKHRIMKSRTFATAKKIT